MDDKTRKALEQSIGKWNDICMGIKKENGESECPLCVSFNKKYISALPGRLYGVSCDGCPIYLKTKRDGCIGTPYRRWRELSDDGFCRTESANHAEAMLKFLIDLLPEEEKGRYGGGD